MSRCEPCCVAPASLAIRNLAPDTKRHSEMQSETLCCPLTGLCERARNLSLLAQLIIGFATQSVAGVSRTKCRSEQTRVVTGIVGCSASVQGTGEKRVSLVLSGSTTIGQFSIPLGSFGGACSTTLR